MPATRTTNGTFSLSAYRGDAKTLLAFDFDLADTPADLAGFTVEVKPPNVPAYYLVNNLCFANPGNHAQVGGEDKFSTVNAPIHKFRWLHVPGSAHQGVEPEFGQYGYTVIPRYFRNGSLLPLDRGLGATLSVEVAPYASGPVRAGFTRGFVQSQAYVHHFGPKAKISPKGAGIQFNTATQAGTAPDRTAFTYTQQYEWLGFTARKLLFEVLQEIEADEALTLDLFAYDLNEPDFIAWLLRIGGSGRARIILDDAPLHHDATNPKNEDQFEQLFAAAAPGKVLRGHFRRYAHDKVLIVYRDGTPAILVTGSTNFSVTGFYVNSNHVLRFDDAGVAKLYADMFQLAWDTNVDAAAFAVSSFATTSHAFTAPLPTMEVNFSPHSKPDAERVLGAMVRRIEAERQQPPGKRSVLFAVMQMTGGKDNPVYDCLNTLHEQDDLISYGISDTPKGISLYRAGMKTGVLVTGKPVTTQLPKPFDEVPGIGLGHQIHHKFVVCGFNGPDPTVYCGSSNLAFEGEQDNGDNLLAIRNEGLATVFAIEAVALVDHFEFLDRMDTGKGAKDRPPPASKQLGAEQAGWYLGTTNAWATKFFDPADLHMADRILFGRANPTAGALPAGVAKFLSAALPVHAGGKPSDNEIEGVVGQAITDMVSKETSATFNWSLVPLKELSDGGLGVRWNAWHALLDDVKRKYLPQSPPYLKLLIDHILVDLTLDKNLRALRTEIVKRVKLARDHQ